MSTDKPDHRSASVKEAGEELPQEQWERFEAAVDAAVKSGPKRKPASKGWKSLEETKKAVGKC